VRRQIRGTHIRDKLLAGGTFSLYNSEKSSMEPRREPDYSPLGTDFSGTGCISGAWQFRTHVFTEGHHYGTSTCRPSSHGGSWRDNALDTGQTIGE